MPGNNDGRYRRDVRPDLWPCYLILPSAIDIRGWRENIAASALGDIGSETAESGEELTKRPVVSLSASNPVSASRRQLISAENVKAGLIGEEEGYHGRRIQLT